MLCHPYLRIFAVIRLVIQITFIVHFQSIFLFETYNFMT